MTAAERERYQRRYAAVIGALVNPNNPNAEPQARDLQAAARALGVQLVILAAGTDGEIDTMFAQLRERHIEALLVAADVRPRLRRSDICRTLSLYLSLSGSPSRRGVRLPVGPFRKIRLNFRI
jgi:hypothetical protein